MNKKLINRKLYVVLMAILGVMIVMGVSFFVLFTAFPEKFLRLGIPAFILLISALVLAWPLSKRVPRSSNSKKNGG